MTRSPTFDLLPVPTSSGVDVLVFYSQEQHWSTIPWEDRTFILAQPVLYAVEALTYGIISSTTSQGARLSVGLRGLRGLVQLVQQKYADVLNIRKPGATCSPGPPAEFYARPQESISKPASYNVLKPGSPPQPPPRGRA